MVSAQDVKELRQRTGAGMMDCKRALEEAGGDMDRAADILREKGLAAAAKKAGRETAEGLVEAYVHAGGRLGVLVEVNCETDFVAQTQEFKSLCHELALQIAAARPEYVGKGDVPQEVLTKEEEILKAQALNEGKPAHIADKMVAGRINKFYEEKCLLEQTYVRDADKLVKDLVNEYVARLGENIVVRRFARLELGEQRGRQQDGNGEALPQ